MSKKVVDGALQEADNFYKEVAGAWQSCAVACKPVNGAWEEIWKAINPLYLVTDRVPNTDYLYSESSGLWYWVPGQDGESCGSPTDNNYYTEWILQTTDNSDGTPYFNARYALLPHDYDSEIDARTLWLYMIEQGYTTLNIEYSLYAVVNGTELDNYSEGNFYEWNNKLYVTMGTATIEGGSVSDSVTKRSELVYGHNNKISIDINGLNVLLQFYILFSFGKYDLRFIIHNINFE